MLAMPYFIVFELLGPPLGAARLRRAAGRVGARACSSSAFLLAFLVVAVLLGQLLSIAALALEEFSFRRHPRGREILRMIGLRRDREPRLPAAHRPLARRRLLGPDAPQEAPGAR